MELDKNNDVVINKINNVRCNIEYNKLFILNQNYNSDNDSECEDDETQTNFIINN